MKYKLSIITLALTLVSLSGFSQSLEFTDKALDKMVLELNLDGPAMITKEMQQELQLSQEQCKAVEYVNKQRFEKILSAEEQYAADPAYLQKTCTEINAKSDKELFSVLTTEQLKQYQKLRENRGRIFYSVNQQD